MTPDPELAPLERLWQRQGASPVPPGALAGRRRAAPGVGWLDWALAKVATAAILMTLTHAPSRGDVLRVGGAVLVIAALMAIRVARRRDEPAIGAATTEYLAAAVAARRRLLRAAGLAQLLCAVVAGVLVPWWIKGLRIHGHAPSPLAIVSAWIPAVVIVATLVTTIRLRRRVRSELHDLAATAHAVGGHDPHHARTAEP